MLAVQQICDSTDEHRLFVGVGNVLRRDDGVGVYICNNIRETEKCHTLAVEVSIENYIGKINSLNPGLLVIIDCVDMKADPGSFMLMPVEKIEDYTFNTHNLSLKKLSDFFKMPVYVLGIQPESIEFGEDLSKSVHKSANKIIQLINQKEVSYSR